MGRCGDWESGHARARRSDSNPHNAGVRSGRHVADQRVVVEGLRRARCDVRRVQGHLLRVAHGDDVDGQTFRSERGTLTFDLGLELAANQPASHHPDAAEWERARERGSQIGVWVGRWVGGRGRGDGPFTSWLEKQREATTHLTVFCCPAAMTVDRAIGRTEEEDPSRRTKHDEQTALFMSVFLFCCCAARLPRRFT